MGRAHRSPSGGRPKIQPGGSRCGSVPLGGSDWDAPKRHAQRPSPAGAKALKGYSGERRHRRQRRKDLVGVLRAGLTEGPWRRRSAYSRHRKRLRRNVNVNISNNNGGFKAHDSATWQERGFGVIASPIQGRLLTAMDEAVKQGVKIDVLALRISCKPSTSRRGPERERPKNWENVMT